MVVKSEPVAVGATSRARTKGRAGWVWVVGLTDSVAGGAGLRFGGQRL